MLAVNEHQSNGVIETTNTASTSTSISPSAMNNSQVEFMVWTKCDKTLTKNIDGKDEVLRKRTSLLIVPDENSDVDLMAASDGDGDADNNNENLRSPSMFSLLDAVNHLVSNGNEDNNSRPPNAFPSHCSSLNDSNLMREGILYQMDDKKINDNNENFVSDSSSCNEFNSKDLLSPQEVPLGRRYGEVSQFQVTGSQR